MKINFYGLAGSDMYLSPSGVGMYGNARGPNKPAEISFAYEITLKSGKRCGEL